MPSTTDTPIAPKRKKLSVLEQAVQGVEGTLARPGELQPIAISSMERHGVRSKLQLDRSVGLLPLEHIRPDPEQPRKVDTSSEEFRNLVASVQDHGVLQPITVRYIEDADHFQIIAGERRFRAAQAAGLREIGAIVKDVDDTATAVQQIEENLHRKNLNPLEEAAAIRRLMSATAETQEQVAHRIHKSPAYVSRVLTIEEQLTRQEKTDLAKLAPAQAPGISLIHTALQTSDPKMRAAILSGGLKRAEARQAVAATKGRPIVGRPKTFSRTFRATDAGATVTVRFEKKKNASREDVLDALDAARAELKRELRGS